MFTSLTRNIREQSHESSTLDGDVELALILGCDTCTLPREDAAVRIEELLENLSILIIDELYIVLAEIALLFHDSLEFRVLEWYIFRIDLFGRIVDLVSGWLSSFWSLSYIG